jgi:hypothetical protein
MKGIGQTNKNKAFSVGTKTDVGKYIRSVQKGNWNWISCPGDKVGDLLNVCNSISDTGGNKSIF